ncbi:DnaE-like DNA polymerase III subunit alpha [Gordonia phage Pupper]|uniref:DNA-directed DNA polymerase n=1 Tax=Gordonia phage Pupper TaxID=2571249 RepID=A0A4Y6ESA0_9CAUD|nr:DNA polymerase [Gordonia phage Pupper]QDF18639.1 DnaE-like DNA polymerase III subunit alpha [Gordonia phage Pupper]
MSSGYAALHNHSEYSFLDGRARTDEMAERAAQNGDEFCAVTDHDEVGGHFAFQKSCQKHNVKPVFGTEARWVHDIGKSRDAKTAGKDSSHVVLLAGDQQGLRNMWALSSLAYEDENFYGKPQLNVDLMREYSAGLWASDGCALTRFAEYVHLDDYDRARQELATLQGIFGERFYMELHTWQLMEPRDDDEMKFWGNAMSSRQANQGMAKLNQAKAQLAKEMGIPLVVVNDAHYAFPDQWQEHRMVWKMSTFKADQTGEDRGQAADWMMNTDELIYWMGQHGISRSVTEEAIKNSGWIAEQCNAEIKPTLEMPRLYATDAEDREAFLKLVEQGFQERYVAQGIDTPEARERRDAEVELILEKNFPGYFNKIQDVVMAAKTGSWARFVADPPTSPCCLVGPGRGSAGGSLVAYALGITNLEPLRYDLLFERFLNPDRADNPDIDVDFPKRKRPGIKEYVGKRYAETGGEVVSIGTRSRSGPAQLVQDIGKALGMPVPDVMKLRKKIDAVSGKEYIDEDAQDEEDEVTFADVLDRDPTIADDLKKYPALVENVVALNGLTRQAGLHAAGVVVSNVPLLGNVPTRRKKAKGSTVSTLSTQFDMREMEELGAVKDDLLSLKHLDQLEMARDYIYKRHGVWIDYDGGGYGTPEGATNVVTIGYDHYADPAIWEQIDRGETAGIFQIGTPGGTKQSVRFKPRNEIDLGALVAVNRPGVIGAGQLDHFLDRRNGLEPVEYPHPMMEGITGETYGILVYQEQMMRASRELAGFTPGEAEGLRKIIGKKLLDKMVALEPKFIDGCLDNEEFVSQTPGGRARARAVAEGLWKSFLAAGSYSFNKSHSIGYAVLACWEIWTKHYYFDEFITACLAVDSATKEKTDLYVNEAAKRNRPILPPDVNQSGAQFTLTEAGIRYGIESIAGVGSAASVDIEAQRAIRPFDSLEDFLTRCTTSGGAKKGVVDSLIKVGAFDFTGESRERLLEKLFYYRTVDTWAESTRLKLTEDELAERVAEKWSKKPKDYDIPDFSVPEVVVAEEEALLGRAVSVDVMAPYHAMIERACIHRAMDAEDFVPGQRFSIGGMVIKARPHKQKNGRMMAFCTLAWRGEEFEFLAFADAWDTAKHFIVVGKPVACDVIKLKGGGCHLSMFVRLDLSDEEQPS